MKKETIVNKKTVLMEAKFGIKVIVLAVITTAIISFILALLIRNLIPVAIVGNETISRKEYVDKLLKGGGRDILTSMVAEKLILQEGKHRGLQVNQKEISAQIRKIDNQMKYQQASLDELLKSQNKTREALEQEIRLQLLVEKIVKKDIVVTDKEIEEYFNNTKVAKGKGAIYESQKITIRKLLYQQKLQQEFKQLMVNLRKKNTVKLLIKL